MVPIVKEFARQHGLDYKADGLQEMYTRHYLTLRANAKAAARDVDPKSEELWGGKY